MEYNTMVEISVMPEDMDKFDEIKSNVKALSIEHAKIEKVDEEDVGFGIKNLRVVILTVDEDGSMSRIENALSNVPGISFNVNRITRI